MLQNTDRVRPLVQLLALARMRLAPMPSFMVCLISALPLGGCMTLRAYDGPTQPRREVAHIIGSMRLSAGQPVVIYLRRVDETTLSVVQNGAEVLPGGHTLLIDCTVTESQQTSRHHLDVELDAGATYRLVANTGRGNRECLDVDLVRVD